MAVVLLAAGFACRAQIAARAPETAPPLNIVIPPPTMAVPTLTLTPEKLPEDTSNVATMTADSGKYDAAAKRWTAIGNVVIRYRRYTLRADSAEYDEQKHVARLAGSPSLDDGRNVVTGTPGSLMTFDLRTREWSVNAASTEVLPEGAVSPVHIKAETLSGTPARLTLSTARLTTCDPVTPQYEITARQITLVPDQQLTARHATAYLYGNRLATVPSLALPLKRSQADRVPFVPSIGSSDVEGLFLKTNVNYTLGDRYPGSLRIDLMEKLGLGLGLRQDYGVPDGKGRVSLYGTSGGGNDLSAALRHEQQVSGWTAGLDTEYRRNSEYYLPDTISGNAALNLQRRRGQNSRQVSLRWDETQGPAPFQNFTSTIAVAQKYSSTGSFRGGIDYSNLSSSVDSESVSAAVDVRQGLGALDAELAANKYSILSGEYLFTPLQRLPELTLRSDARRLGLTRSKSSPLLFQVSTGHFVENEVSGDRQLFAVEAPMRPWRFGPNRLDVGGAFRQAVYATDAAQYTLNANVRLTVPVADRSDVSLAWSYQNPQGYSPFRFDRPFPYNTLMGSLKLASSKAWEFRAGTGYDARNSTAPWRDLLTYFRWEPGEHFKLINNISVAMNGPPAGQSSAFRYVNTAFTWKSGKLRLDADSRYFPETGRFGRLLGNLQTPVGRTWTVRAVAGTDSGQHYRHLLVVKDLGCLEAIGGFIDDRGWRNERGIRFMMRIKAFPIAEGFSAGMGGENLNIGVPSTDYGGISTGPMGLSPGL